MAAKSLAGRLKGLRIATTAREVEHVLTNGGILPLEMMMRVGQFYYNRHIMYRHELEELETQAEDGPSCADIIADSIKDAEKKTVLFGDLAVEVAFKLTPYCHARVASKLEITNDTNIKVEQTITLDAIKNAKNSEELAMMFSEAAREEQQDPKQRAALEQRMNMVRIAPPKRQLKRASDNVVDLPKRVK